MTTGSVKKAAAIVMGGMIVSRLLGYIRYKTIFYYFGRGYETDAFFGAFAVSDLLYILASGGAMTVAFIPVYSELLQKGKEKDAHSLASAIATITVLFVGVCVMLGMIFAPQLASVLVPGFKDDPKTFELCVTIIRIIFPMVVLTSLSALFNGILNAHDHFAAPAIAWCMHNIGIITAAVLFHEIYGIRSLAYGVLAGAFSMLLVQAPVIYAKGVRYIPTIGAGNPAVKKMLKLFLPAMLGLSVSQVNLLILPNTFGSLMGEGAVSALSGGVRLLLLPLGIFGNAISMAIFPTLSRQAGGGKMAEFRSTLTRGVNTTFAFALPSMVAFLVLGEPITRVLFGGGEFTVADCRATAFALAFYAVGLPGHTALTIVSRGFYSMQDTRTPFLVGVFSVLFISVPFSMGIVESRMAAETLIVLKPLLLVCRISPFFYLGVALKGLSYGGVALSVSIGTLFNFVTLTALLRRRVPGLSLAPIVMSLARVSAAAVPMAAACWFVDHALVGFDPIVRLLAGGSTGAVVYLGAGKIFRIKEIDEVVDMVKTRFGRKTPSDKPSD